MHITIQDPIALGLVIRAVRKASDIRQDDLAGPHGVSPRFASELERGKPTVQLGKVLQLLNSLGIQMTLEVPDAVGPLLEDLRVRFERQGGQHQRRRTRKASPAAQDAAGPDTADPRSKDAP